MAEKEKHSRAHRKSAISVSPALSPSLLGTSAGPSGGAPANEGTYQGGMANGRRHGQGVLTYKNGDVYDGQWDSGVQSGKGRLTLHVGCSYKGTFQNGQASARGAFTFRAGDGSSKPVAQWWREGLAVELLVPEAGSAKDVLGVGPGVASFRNQLAAWKALLASLVAAPPPVWSAQALAELIAARIATDPVPVLSCVSAIEPVSAGLVLAMPDADTGQFVAIHQAVLGAGVLEKAFELLLKGTVRRELAIAAAQRFLPCKSDTIENLIVLVCSLRDALLRMDVNDTLRGSIVAAVGKAFSRFKKSMVSEYPALLAAIWDIETIKFDGSVREVSKILQPLPALLQEQRQLDSSLPFLMDTFQNERKALEPLRAAGDTASFCVQSVCDLYTMMITDLINQRLERLKCWRKIIDHIVPLITPESASRKIGPARFCLDMTDVVLATSHELQAAVKELPPLRGQRMQHDFGNVGPFMSYANEIVMLITKKPATVPQALQRGMSGQLPHAQKGASNVIPSHKLKISMTPLNKDLVGTISAGNWGLLSDLFNSCDSAIHTFAARLLATIFLPWESATQADKRHSLMTCPEETCSNLVGLIVFHTVRGTMGPVLMHDSLKLLCRLLASDAMKRVLVNGTYEGETWLHKFVVLLEGTPQTCAGACRALAITASAPMFRKDILDCVGVQLLAKLATEPIEKAQPELQKTIQTLAAQALGYISADRDCIKVIKGQGVLAQLFDYARSGAISLHYEIAYEDLKIGKPIGRGVYAEVCEAEWRGMKVAAKVFTEGSMQFRLEDFMLEVAIMSVAQHPNVLKLHGAVMQRSRTEESQFILVTELVENGSLQTMLMKQGALPVGKILKYALDISAGLTYLHSLDMVHRDLKTANVLVTAEDKIKIADFGLSRAVSRLSMTVGVGTPKWEAPECFQVADYTTAADVYSFGIVLWEMLTAKEPYPDIQSIFELKHAVCDKKRRPEIPSNCPPWLSELMKACWQHSPSRRPMFEAIWERLENVRLAIATKK